jgi:hypothetical protein
MRLVTAKLVKTFAVGFAEEDREDVWRVMRDQITMMPGALWCSFGERVKTRRSTWGCLRNLEIERRKKSMRAGLINHCAVGMLNRSTA